MDINKILEGSLDDIADNIFNETKNTTDKAKAIQKQRIGENVQYVIDALKKIEADLRGDLRDEYKDVANKLSERIISIKNGQDGRNGADGRAGKNGRAGRDGLAGAKGADGLPGRDGLDGSDGVSVMDANIDFDGSLIISLSNGRVINVGEVVSQDLADKIQVISTMSTNTAIAAITGGTIDGTVIGGTTPAAGTFTTLRATGVATFAAGTVALPSITTTGDTNTGVYFPAADTVRITAGGTERGNFSSTGLAVTGGFSATGNVTISGASSLKGSYGAGGITLNFAAGDGALFSNTTGSSNTASGVNALFNNTTGVNNTASGSRALSSNTTGSSNTASGVNALFSNTTGIDNTASGVNALSSNTTGSVNTASGSRALSSNTTGSSNTASGVNALSSNTTGIDNTASGVNALSSNTTGVNNTASGSRALSSNTTGSSNTASGVNALFSNTTGVNNTASGVNALSSNTTGSGNTALNPLNSAGTYLPVFNPTVENNRFCMGSTGVTNAYIQVAWTVVSDARDKIDFAPVPHGIDFVCKLQPTAYRYKIDRETAEGHGPVRYGFKAQDVLALEGDTPVIVDAEDADKLRFNDQSLLAVLVKAIQEQQTLITQLTARITLLEGA